MTYEEYIKVFVEHYKLDGIFSYQRCNGRNIIYKKVLIFILRNKFFLNYEQIATIFKNDHTTIIYHYWDIFNNVELSRLATEAWKLYQGEEPIKKEEDNNI